MTISVFPIHRRARQAPDPARSKRDVMLAELLQLLGGTAASLGAAFAIDELRSLSELSAQLQLQLLETSEYSMEGVIVRHNCQQLMESVAMHLIELSRDSARGNIEQLNI